MAAFYLSETETPTIPEEPEIPEEITPEEVKEELE